MHLKLATSDDQKKSPVELDSNESRNNYSSTQCWNWRKRGAQGYGGGFAFCIWLFPWICVSASCPSLHVCHGLGKACPHGDVRWPGWCGWTREACLRRWHAHFHSAACRDDALTWQKERAFQEVRVTGTTRREAMHKGELWQAVRKQVCISVDEEITSPSQSQGCRKGETYYRPDATEFVRQLKWTRNSFRFGREQLMPWCCRIPFLRVCPLRSSESVSGSVPGMESSSSRQSALTSTIYVCLCNPMLTTVGQHTQTGQVHACSRHNRWGQQAVVRGPMPLRKMVVWWYL